MNPETKVEHVKRGTFFIDEARRDILQMARKGAKPLAASVFSDALRLHALIQAMEESAKYSDGSMYGPDALAWIKNRADEIAQSWGLGE